MGTPQNLSEALDFKLTPIGCIEELDWNARIQVIESDILESKNLFEISRGADAIIHLAANTGVAPSVAKPLYDCNVNVIGTLNALECCRINKIKKFIFASSGAPLGEQTPPLSEQSLPQPASPYGASKLAGEGYCFAYSKSFGIQTIGLRFGNVYGPGSVNKSSVIAKFIKLALARKKIDIYGDGTQTRDFIHIDDLISAIELALKVENVSGELFQIATARETSVNTLLYLMKTVFEEQNLVFPSVVYKEKRIGDVKHNFSDTTKARKILGWEPKVSLVNGLKGTLNYFQSGVKIDE